MKNNIYTIGYTLFQRESIFDLEGMYKTLHQFGVTHLVDVRSVPFSKQYPLCNEGSLRMSGKTFGIPYIHMPELGAKALPDLDVFQKQQTFSLRMFSLFQKVKGQKEQS